MPLTVTDYHVLCRDAVKSALADADLQLGVNVLALDDPEDIEHQSVPSVVVCCVGPEQERPEFTTNASTGKGYPIAVAYLMAGVSSGEKTPNVPTLTEFRRAVVVTFENKRLSGVAQVGWCEVVDSGPLFDPKNPKFQKVSTAMIVTAVGKFPRT